MLLASALIPRSHPPSVSPLASNPDDVLAFVSRLDLGLPEALRYLNLRTPHRFTGVYRFDQDVLRNVALVDKWTPELDRGEDVPLRVTYCSRLVDNGGAMEILDGRTDARTPHMRDDPVVSYCGAVILDAQGRPWGSLCHFDMAYCEAKVSELPLLMAAAAHIHTSVTAEQAPLDARGGMDRAS